MGDRIERICAHPAAFWVFTALFVVGCIHALDATNIAISYFTAGLLLLTTGSARRSDKAMHAKLDDIECAIAEANSDNARLEDRSEQEIEQIRERAGHQRDHTGE